MMMNIGTRVWIPDTSISYLDILRYQDAIFQCDQSVASPRRVFLESSSSLPTTPPSETLLPSFRHREFEKAILPIPRPLGYGVHQGRQQSVLRFPDSENFAGPIE